LSSLRHAIALWLESMQPAEAEAAALVGACSEIAADAIDTALADAIEVEGAVDGGDVVVRLAVEGIWGIAERPSRFVAALLVDDMAVETRGDRTSVVLRKSLDLGLRSRRDL
jgi:hypothetical protein